MNALCLASTYTLDSCVVNGVTRPRETTPDMNFSFQDRIASPYPKPQYQILIENI